MNARHHVAVEFELNARDRQDLKSTSDWKGKHWAEPERLVEVLAALGWAGSPPGDQPLLSHELEVCPIGPIAPSSSQGVHHAKCCDWLMSILHRAIYLTGPTAVGKTLLGVMLARRLNAEVIALDSMTLYRRLDIGTAKPTLAERGGVPHHLIDVLEPSEAASVADYRRWAEEALTGIEARGRRGLFVGGTALYLKALLRGLFDGPAGRPELRETLERDAERLGAQGLHDRLRQLDPRSADRLHPHDRRRVIRALEVTLTTGRPLSEHQVEHDRPAPQSVAVFALERPRVEVHDRINRRVEQMFAAGLIAEVRGLLAEDPPLGPVAAQGVGYREGIDLLAGRIDESTALARTQARTRQFAKRQATWFRGLGEVRPFPLGADEPVDVVVDRLTAQVEAVISAGD